MRKFSREEIMMNQEDVYSQIKSGEVFIYPTDTIYGLGCNAMDDDAVLKIRELKKRPDSPLSVIVPGKDWIRENCEVTKEAEEWINKLPGPYTLILKLKNKTAVSKQVVNGSNIGVRIPDHWFQELSTILDLPLITTSVNQTGKRFMTSIDDLDPEIAKGLHFVVLEGEINGTASKIIHLEGESIRVRER